MEFKCLDIPEHLIISDPISYIEMITSVNNARAVITDSGGLQKEAYFFKVPCIIPRDETEWTELVEIGWNKVVGTKKENIVRTVLSAVNENLQNKRWVSFYGDGNASEKIAKVLLSYEG
jgi:UDP-N-acetylglucosamine 2-epimerase